MDEPQDTMCFSLDADAAIAAIAALWGLDRDDPRQWDLQRFGPSRGTAVENLTGVLFSPARGLLGRPAGAEVHVYPIDDQHATPLVVCVSTGDGPMLCSGVEDFDPVLAGLDAAGPEPLLSAVGQLLEIATGIYREGAVTPAGPPRLQALPDADAGAVPLRPARASNQMP